MSAIEINARYVLTGPDGSRAVFNDNTDVDFVGMLTDVTGLDSPDVRESSDDLVQMDGGVHGDFFYGRRPITLTGIILNPASAAERNYRQNLLAQASNAMRGDAVLSWNLSSGEEQQVLVRRQQPLRVTGSWQKQFQLQMVSADPRIYSQALHNTATLASTPSGASAGRGYPKAYNVTYSLVAPLGQLIVSNDGNTLSYPILRVFGPGTDPIITNYTTGQQLGLLTTLSSSDFLEIDMYARTIMFAGTSARYSLLDFPNSEWWGLIPGTNDVRINFSTFSGGSGLAVSWRDAWV